MFPLIVPSRLILPLTPSIISVESSANTDPFKSACIISVPTTFPTNDDGIVVYTFLLPARKSTN